MSKQSEPQKQVTTPSKPATLHKAKVGHSQGTGSRMKSTKND